MPGRKRPPGGETPKPAPVTRVDPEVEQLLDRIDEALVTGAQDQVAALVEPLWGARHRLPEVLTQRIIAGRTRIPAFAFDLLIGFAGSQAAKYLRRIADTPQVQDIVRFGAMRRAVWPQRGEAKRRLAFLDTLQDAEVTLVVAVDQGTDAWPPDSEVLEEVLDYLIVLPDERRRTVVTHIAAELGSRAGWLLHAVLHIEDPPTQHLALNELVRLRAPGADGPIGRLARTARDAEVRAAAAAAVQRLRLYPVDAARAPEPFPLPPVEEAHISMIDGSGGQVLLVLRQLAEGVFMMADVLSKDDWGIKDVFGAYRATVETVDDAFDRIGAQDIELVESDLAGVRGVVADALAVNVATGRPVPPAFELWEPLLHDAYPPRDDEPVAVTVLDDAPYAGRDDLVRLSGALADHPFFDSWGFEPAETSRALIAAPPPGRAGRLTDRQYRPMIAQLVTPSAREVLRRRLCRQAWLLDQDGDEAMRDLALATAAHLTTATPADLVKLPFLRALVDHSLVQLFGPFAVR